MRGVATASHHTRWETFMKLSLSRKMPTQTYLKPLAVLAIGAVAVVGAMAQSAYFSGPSVSKVSAAAQFSGKGPVRS